MQKPKEITKEIGILLCIDYYHLDFITQSLPNSSETHLMSLLNQLHILLHLIHIGKTFGFFFLKKKGFNDFTKLGCTTKSYKKNKIDPSVGKSSDNNVSSR